MLSKFKYSNLEYLSLGLEHEENISDKGLQCLTSLTKLRCFNKKITSKSFDNMPNLTSFCCGNKYLSIESIVTSLKEKLQTLKLENEESVNASSVGEFVPIDMSLFMRLTKLYLSPYFRYYGDLPTLRKLEMSEDTWISLKNLTNLAWLNLRNNNAFVNDSEIKHLTTLTYLNLTANRSITENGIRKFTSLTNDDEDEF